MTPCLIYIYHIYSKCREAYSSRKGCRTLTSGGRQRFAGVRYAWVVFGAALLVASILSTAGAIGTMMLAVMTRVARGHTDRALEEPTA
jgi:hypothetical protein